MYCRCRNKEGYPGTFNIGQMYRWYWYDKEHKYVRIVLDWLKIGKTISREYFYSHFEVYD